MDYNRYNALSAWEHLKTPNPEVLVVGANTGKDCSYFVEFGAKSVVGLDVIEEIGSEYQNPKVTYIRESAEAMTSLSDDSFDLVYCYATMEHVPDVQSAFSEMSRVVKKGGVIYSLASPLWRSPMGHHMGEFEKAPWIHLVMSEPEIVDYAIKNNLYPSPERARHKVAYMLNPEYFNMRRSDEYIEACARLSGLHLLKNEILLESRDLLSHENAKIALAKGISEQDLLGVTHRLIAVKLRRKTMLGKIFEKLAYRISNVRA